MNRWRWGQGAVLALGLLACTSPGQGTQAQPSAVPAGRAAAFAANARLAHAVNFGNMLEAPQEGEWGLSVQERFFDLARAAGFSAIRVPIRWDAHAAAQAPYTLEPAFLARVDWVVGQARTRGLAVILDFHHYDRLFSDPAGQRARFLAIWRQVAGHYRSAPADVLLEIMNEPHGPLEAVWNDYQAQALAVIRQSDPTRVVIVGPAAWGSAAALKTLTLPDDPNLIVTFHHYAPMDFTHQGADWVSPVPPVGVAWPGPGARPVGGWQNWSWDTTLAAADSGAALVKVSPQRAWAGLYLHRDDPLTQVREIVVATDRAVELSVACMEAHRGGPGPTVVPIRTRAAQVTRVPVGSCGGTGTLRDLWLMYTDAQAPAPYTLTRLEVVTAAGAQPVFGTAQDEVGGPLRLAAAWGKAHQRPMFMGEFGAYKKGDVNSRARWATFVRAEAERLGLSWAWWEFGAGFGVYDPQKGEWDMPVLRALLPGAKP